MASTAIDVQKVSEDAGVSRSVVHRVLSLFLAIGTIRATFTPRHRSCGKIIGGGEEAATTIQSKAENGDYGQLCFSCGEPIEDQHDIEIQINFWELAADGE